MTMKDYRTIVVGTDGSALAGPTVAPSRLARQARRRRPGHRLRLRPAVPSGRGQERPHSRRRPTHRSGPRPRGSRASPSSRAMATASAEGATVSATLLIDGEPPRR